jgi:hypothetical protein
MRGLPASRRSARFTLDESHSPVPSSLRQEKLRGEQSDVRFARRCVDQVERSIAARCTYEAFDFDQETDQLTRLFVILGSQRRSVRADVQAVQSFLDGFARDHGRSSPNAGQFSEARRCSDCRE